MTETFPTLLIAWAALGAAAVSPGPNMVAVVSRGLGSGMGAALAVTLGIAIGGFCWAVLTLLGLGLVFQTYPELLRVLGVVGGGYLAWLGFKGWRAALTGAPSDIMALEGLGLWRDAGHGLVVTATNPKVALMWASISTFVSPAIMSPGALVVFAGVSAVILFAIYGSYGVLFSLRRVRRLYARFQSVSDAAFGTVFGGIGIGMVIRSFRP